MGFSEIILILLLGLAVFGGGITIRFNGIARRFSKPELKDGEQKKLDE